LLKILERKEVNQEEFEKNFEQTRNELLNTKQNKLFQSIYLKLRDKAGIKTNYELFSLINSEILSRYQSEID